MKTCETEWLYDPEAIRRELHDEIFRYFVLGATSGTPVTKYCEGSSLSLPIDPFVRCYWRSEPEATYVGSPKTGGELLFAWWNTGVSSSRGDKKVDGRSILGHILQLSECCDMVGLGELADEGLLQTIRSFVQPNREVRALEELDGQHLKFNTAIIYNKDRLAFDERVDPNRRNLFVADGAVISNQYRIAQKARFKIQEVDGLVDFYFSHWRMHDQSADEPDNKEEAARIIHEDAFGRCGENRKSAAVVMMGDFNAEPHENHFRKLLVSRSSLFVGSQGGLFNPFWRQLHDERGTLNGVNYKLRTRSCLFDYIMVSAPFVNLPNFNCQEWIACDLTYRPPPSQHRPIILKLSWTSSGEEEGENE